MFRNARGLAVVLVVFFSLSLPLIASASPGRPDRQESRAERFLALLWERLTAPIAALLDGAVNGAATTQTDPTPPPPSTNPGSSTDGRAILDPIG